MKGYYILILLALSFFGCQPENKDRPAQESGTINISAMLQSYHDQRQELYPLEATSAGNNLYNDNLPNNISESYRKRLRDFYQSFLDQVYSIDSKSLNEQERLSYEILKWECEINLLELEFPDHLKPIDQMWSMNLVVGQLASGESSQPFKTVEDYKNWLDRLKGYERWTLTAIDNMRKGIQQGVVLPKSLVTKVIPQLDALAHGPVDQHLFYKPIEKLPVSFSESEKEQITSAYAGIIGETIIPLYLQLRDFFKDEYMAAARESSGINVLPNGKAWYNLQIKKYTTTNLSAEEIFEIGKIEVARLRQEMEKVKTQVGFSGDLNSFFEHVRNKPELMPFNYADQVIANFNAIHEKIKPNLAKLFDLVPKTKFEVRRTEAFREASASAEYNKGSLDGTRPGIFYVPVPNANKYNIFTDENLFLHEAIPGHHYQISLQQENKSLPDFRKSLWYSAYGEGWALYCESLGTELGLYTDPYQYFGMLSAEMHRAIRLVVDTGIHSKGWTREQAIKYSLENEAEAEASIISEVERYMAKPGQALSYKIGQIKIMELRARAEDKLGDKFNIKTFHNKVLEVGCVPLELLEKRIDDWISESE